MSKMNNVAIILKNTDNFIMMQTIDRTCGKSNHYYISKEKLREAIVHEGRTVIDTDLGDFIKMWVDGETMHIDLYILHGEKKLTGFHQSFDIPMRKIESVLAGENQTHLYFDRPYGQAKIIMSESANALLRKMNAQERNAFRKSIARNFMYGSHAEVYLYADGAKDFFFRADNLCGGFILHRVYKGGRCEMRYEVHT